MEHSLFLGSAAVEARISGEDEIMKVSDAHRMMNIEMVNSMRNMPAEAIAGL